LQKLALKVFVEDYDLEHVIAKLLCEEVTLGRNTDVMLMSAEKGWRYFLSSEILRRPLGMVIPPQCKGCGRLRCSKSQNVPDDPFSIEVTCHFCDHKFTLQTGLDDYFTKEALKGQEGWGIGLEWGPYLTVFPNMAAAISRGAVEEELENRRKAEKLKKKMAARKREKEEMEIEDGQLEEMKVAEEEVEAGQVLEEQGGEGQVLEGKVEGKGEEELVEVKETDMNSTEQMEVEVEVEEEKENRDEEAEDEDVDMSEGESYAPSEDSVSTN